ncbi:MAG: SRPBCC family protein [Ilumatobacter sp.]|uniref:SRPBCC family protein n=1 Tax=Ilumatobacter sp. TaxID=1967498 RepID=UPI0026298CDC|nr:SRPBCC family protein [Ilumatobacter sp.]MDJ0769633.1 SRPBCC family protein [Ilumatobacter sp.]
MRVMWVERDIEAPPEALWDLLTDVSRWSAWGPSVSDASLDGDVFELGSTGSVRTTPGVSFPFSVTAFEPGHRWRWSIAHVPATDHRVVRTEHGCRVGFGVPVWAAPYAVVCRSALRRLERLAIAR